MFGRECMIYIYMSFTPQGIEIRAANFRGPFRGVFVIVKITKIKSRENK